MCERQLDIYRAKYCYMDETLSVETVDDSERVVGLYGIQQASTTVWKKNSHFNDEVDEFNRRTLTLYVIAESEEDAAKKAFTRLAQEKYIDVYE